MENHHPHHSYPFQSITKRDLWKPDAITLVNALQESENEQEQQLNDFFV